MNLHGIFPPITTPFTDREDVDTAALTRNVQRWMTTGIHGVVVLGSNGEAPYLGEDEAYSVIATAREQVPRDRYLIAGAGAESTRETIAAVTRAADAGADVVLVRTPAYYKSQMSVEVFVRHYTAVADASRVPVLLYDAPMFTGVTLPVAAVAKLAEHRNIIGLKESAPDIGLVADFIASTPASFQVLVGSAPTLYASLCVGAVGGIVAIACVTPDLCVRLLTLAREGRHAEALALQRLITPLAKTVTGVYGVGGLKAALDLAGYVGGRPRLPLAPPAAQGIEVIRGQLEKLQALGV
jgi:4-hydroxy-2-oxoglutarate aldolase